MGTVALVAGILLLLGCALLGYLAIRRVRLMRGGGVDVGLRRHPAAASRDAAGGWHVGVGRYRGDKLAWYRLTSLRPGPNAVVNRTETEIVERREPTGPEAYAVPQGGVVLCCRIRGEDVDLAMAPGVLTGFLAWLEAAPPGRSTGYRRAS